MSLLNYVKTDEDKKMTILRSKILRSKMLHSKIVRSKIVFILTFAEVQL